MKPSPPPQQELYTDQIIPIYVLEEKLKANFVSIQRRLKESEQRSADFERRILYLEKMKSSTSEIEKIVTSKLLQFNQNIDPSAFRKQITTQVETKFREIKLELPAQVRRESQSLITTELISIRRMMGERREGEERGIESVMQEYGEQRSQKQVEGLREEVEKVGERVRVIAEEAESYKASMSTQIGNIVGNLNRMKGSNVVYMTEPTSEAVQEVRNSQNDRVVASESMYQLEQSIAQINSKLLQFVSRPQYELQTRRTKQSLNTFTQSLSLITKELQNNDSIHSLILKTNQNVEHIQLQYQSLKLSSDSFAKSLEETRQLFGKKINHVEKHKSSTQIKEMNEMTERINQLERLNNYQEYIEKVQAVLDQHHVQEPPNPRKTLYMDYINHLEAKVESISREVKAVTQKIQIEAEGTKLMEVSKVDIEEVWKAIMILESIIESKTEMGTSRKKIWSTSDKAYELSSGKNTTPQKQRGSETVYIRRTETHRAGGFGQKMGSSKNIRHLIDEKPQRLERDRRINGLKLPQLQKQQQQMD